MIVNRNATRTWSETGLDGIVSCPTWSGTDGDGGCIAKLAEGARFPRHRDTMLFVAHHRGIVFT